VHVIIIRIAVSIAVYNRYYVFSHVITTVLRESNALALRVVIIIVRVS